MMLKSLMCLTRSMSSYKLSRSQNADSYVICYRVYSGDPNRMHLGTNEGKMNVGAVATPLGTVYLSSVYRWVYLLAMNI